MSSGEVNVDKATLFSLKDLEKATDHFNLNIIIGKGGQGTVRMLGWVYHPFTN